MNQKNLLRMKIEKYLKVPLLLAIFWLVAAGIIFVMDKKSGIVMLLFDVIYMVMVLVIYYQKRPYIMAEIVNFAFEHSQIQKELLKDLALPYTLIDIDGRFLWSNQQFYEVIGKEKLHKKNLFQIFPELTKENLPIDRDQASVETIYEERNYRMEMKRVHACWEEEEEFVDANNSLIAVYLFDETEIKKYIKENQEQKMVACLIYIDNYEEALESIDEVKESLLTALINRKLTKYMQNAGAIIKRLEKDKYLAVLQKKNLTQLQNDKFSILDEAKSVSIGNTMPVTLSIGMGISNETYAQSYNFARVAIDLALARGGDQAVIKQGKNITYYGGKREQTSKNTRVKARVKAEALREFIMAKDQVIVMGHRIADVDSLGAAIGIWRAARTMEKKAYIVLNDITTSVRPIYNSFRENAAYPDDMFITSAQVPEMVTENTMVVVVDTNKPEITECPELLKRAKTIVVFDHHRQGSAGIENTVLSYIEPYASSACEMVAEVLQYIADDIKISATEANSMYAGIMIDTNNFMNRTGVRTFEAAAFLRRCGADITHVRKLFRDNLEEYRVKASIISNAQVFHDEYAIATCTDADIDSPTIIGAQAANELLNIKGIKASFVLTEYYGKIYVSARAIDEVNVQIIMEKLGGGGHINTAGAQFPHTNMREAIAELKNVIDIMISEGDI